MNVLRYIWAAPCSVLGLAVGALALALGATARIRSGALEFGGGRLCNAAVRLPRPFGFAAITLGHVILGVDHATLARVRAHEQAHVRQYERWGPLFIPAYLGSSLFQMLRGRDPYLDNYFELQARSEAQRLAHMYLPPAQMMRSPVTKDD